MSENLNWRNVHGIGFSGSKMESTRENKVKVLTQIKRGNVTVQDKNMARLVLSIDEEDDYVDVFYSEGDPQSALEQMEESVKLSKDSLPKHFHSNLPLRSSLELCREIHDPDLPDITDSTDVLAYCM